MFHLPPAPRIFALLALMTLFPAGLLAQGAENLFNNGGFEQFTPRENLWDGVDSDGYLSGERRTVPAVTESGAVSELPMPISVNFVDVNGDGLPDLVTVDPAGYFRAYINSGTKAAPKFTHCEMIPLFLSRELAGGGRTVFENKDPRAALKLSLFDWSHRGVLDLVVGDYAGELFFLPNAGSATAPDWRQPRMPEDVMVKTSKSGVLWGNLLAPAAWDFDRDGKTDLLLGEGSYSANAVHLLVNKGTGSRPDFSEDARYYLAYGDGREQLVPTVADMNGDGQPDVIVGDRKGTVGIYLNPGGWKPGVELPLASLVSFGSVTSLGGCVAPFAADWNGDGLIDLIIGKTNGRIAVALNTGTKAQPKFDPPFEVKGEDLWNRDTLAIPTVWSTDSGAARGNLYGFIATVDAAHDPQAMPPEGARCLKAGYFPCPNRVFKVPMLDIPPNEDVREYFDLRRANDVRDATRAAITAGTHVFVVQNVPTAPLKVGGTYQLSFKVKGAGVKDARFIMAYYGRVENAPVKIEHGERDTAKIIRDESTEIGMEPGTFSPTPQWTAVTKTFKCHFQKPALKDLETTKAAVLQIRFTLPTLDSVLYLDDVQLVPKS